jgi:long-chain acyl-CoA synthetase
MPTSATSLNLANILDHHAHMRPTTDAVVLGDRRLTYAQLHAMASRVAAALQALGLQPGDHVALTCPNVPYFPMVYFGILKAGCVVVPLNVLLKPREIAYHLKDSDAKAYFCFEGTADLPMATWGQEGVTQVPACPHFIVMTADPSAPQGPGGTRSLGTLLAAHPDGRFATVPRRPDDTAVILYTSGTTGQPKGAELTHANLQCNAWGTAGLVGPFIDTRADARNVSLITLPLFHSFGQVVQMVTSLVMGHTIVLLPRFEPAAVLQAMTREQINFWAAVPTMFWTLAEHVAKEKIDVSGLREHLRVCTSGGAAMPVELMKRFESLFGVRILEGYGLSETSPVATFNHAMRPSKPGTVGTPLLGIEVAVVDPMDRPVPTGEVGEVVIRGHNIMKGYYKRPEATADVMRNGWFHSGDLGRLDEDGYLSIVDRTKDMIIRGGFNVYPREIEEVLMTHPAVSLCAVVGIPDERLGEEVKAYIVRAPGSSATEQDVLAWCHDQFAAYKTPRLVEFREQLPMTATGKVLKRELR